jgi:hypothetical protein|tara:strand:- start:1767 stop:1955 length:189 start_codon:yes stop_codon:yes gene_type:complete
MKTRTLKDGTEVEQYEHNIILNVITKCPSKYKLIDMETGQEYIGQKPIGGEKQVVHWKKIDG